MVKPEPSNRNRLTITQAEWQAVLVPFGILNTQSDQLSIYMGQSAETTDFIVDCLTDWWHNNQSDYTELEELVIDLDGGPAIRSNRTQFIKRIIECISGNWLKNQTHLLSTLS